MKLLGVIVGTVVAARAAAADPAPAATHPLRLDEAIQLAMTRNERSAIAELNVTVAEAGVDKAKVAFLPVLAATGSDTYRPRDKPIDTATGALTLSQPLIAPSAFPLYDQAKHSLQGTREQTVDDKRQLMFDTAKAFFNVLLADEVVKAAQRQLQTSNADLADTDAQVKAQLVSSNDVTRAQISVAGSVRELASDQGSLDAAFVALEFVLNAPAKSLETPAVILAAGQKPVPDLDALVKESVARRPDLASRKDQAIAAHDFAREPHMRFFPTLGVAAQIGVTDPAPVSNNHYVDGSVALTATWTIYDAGSRWADERSREASAKIADLTADTLIRTIDSQVRTAAVQLTSAQHTMAAAQDAMVASRKSADEEAILYHQGLAKAIELIDANNERFAAEVAFAEAQFSVATAYLALRQAMGLDPLGEDLK